MRALEEIEVSDPSELEAAGAKARAAVALLTAQKAKLVDELKARRQLIVLLAGSVQRQHEQVCARAQRRAAMPKGLRCGSCRVHVWEERGKRLSTGNMRHMLTRCACGCAPVSQCTRLDEALRGCEAMLGTASQAEEQVATMAEQMASISAMASEQL